MSEQLLLWFSLGMIGAWVSLVIVAITLYDVRAIRQEKALRKHPYARRWRRKPATSIQYVGENVLPKVSLRDAKHQLQYQPHARFVEIIPPQQFPEVTRQFFAMYRRFADMPLIKLRSILNTRSSLHNWPMVSRQPQRVMKRDYMYPAAGWVVAVCHIWLLFYVTYVAVAAGDIAYLVTYISLFCLWLGWSIMNYPQLAMVQRIGYLLLIPASLSYFLWRVFAALFRPVRFMRTYVQQQMLS
jgi:hypothetical protein